MLKTSNLKYFIFLFFSIDSFAQQLLGIAGSNYLGTNSIYSNPTNIIDNRHKLFINLAAADLFVGNNSVRWNAPVSPLAFFFDKATNKNKYPWQSDYLESIENNNKRNFNILLEARGPAVLYMLNQNESIAITTRGRGAISFSNVSPTLAKLIEFGAKDSLRVPIDGRNLSMAANENIYSEFAFSYGKNISLNPENSIKYGITIKRIVAISNFHFIAENSNYQLVKVSNPNPTGPNDQYLERVLNLQKLNAQYGYSDEKLGFQNFNFSPGYIFGKPNPGRTYGFDIGFGYEYRPEYQKYTFKEKGIQKWDNTQNKYQFKVGFSIMDIGKIKFDNLAYIANFEEQKTNKLIFDKNIKPASTARLINDLNNNSNLDVPLANDKKMFYAHLPTVLNIFVDYKIKDNIYVYSTLVQNLTKANSIGIRTPSLVAVVPRYETKLIEVAIPISLLNDYQNFGLGLSLRVGPVFIGSDNLAGINKSLKTRGLDIFAGAFIPIFHKLPKSSTECYYQVPQNKLKNKYRKLFEKSIKD